MTTIQESLVTYLEAQVSAAGNAYPHLIPQDADRPAWSYIVIDDDQLLAHDGPTGLYFARIQIDLIGNETASASDYLTAAALAALMRAALDGYRGAMGSAAIHYCKTVMSEDYGSQRESPSARFDIRIVYKLS